MAKKQTPPISVSLNAEEASRLAKVKAALKKRTGVDYPTTQVLRMGLASLAGQENVK